MNTTIVWFRNDLRLSDNPALSAALKNSDAIIPLFIHAPKEAGHWSPGAASNWWLHHSLTSLDISLRKRGSVLQLQNGNSKDVLFNLCKRQYIRTIYANRVFDPPLVARDKTLCQHLAEHDIELQLFDGSTLLSPDSIRKKDGNPYRMFTPFWRTLNENLFITAPLAAPSALPRIKNPARTVTIDALGLLPTIPWDKAFYKQWRPGEKHALQLLQEFTKGNIDNYTEDRDRPDREGTSRLSPHLHFGELSPRQIFWTLKLAGNERSISDAGIESYLREIGWREFAYYVLRHFPQTCDKPMDPRFDGFPWNKRKTKLLRAWQQGQTGIPIVDAGMRQLWHNGWMHNRVRMIVASFLTKNCLIDWREGARWFWNTLVDADLASNSLGWQWTAGCGVDAAPYFRIFNPIRQGEKFDPKGEYVRQWLPELAGLSNKYIHQPWNAPHNQSDDAGFLPGTSYPHPVVDLAHSRQEALSAFASIKYR